MTREVKSRAEVTIINSPLKLLFALGDMACLAAVKLGGDKVRHFGPDPYNAFQHASNFTIAFAVAATIGWGVARVADRLGASPEKARKIGMAVGFGAMCVANFVAETSWGVETFHIINHLPDGQVVPSVPDPVDMISGDIGSAAGVMMLDVRSRSEDDRTPEAVPRQAA